MSKTIIFVDNQISIMMANAAIRSESIDYGNIILFALRDCDEDWFGLCKNVFRSPFSQKRSWKSNISLILFFIRSIRLIRGYLHRSDIERVLIVNNDNIIINYIVNNIHKQMKDVEISVLVEGIMNYQDITIRNRSKFNLAVKMFISLLLGFKYIIPKGHLSGAYMQQVKKVYSFSAKGLKAPVDKICVCELAVEKKITGVKNNAILLVLSGLYKWMPATKYDQYCDLFMKHLSTIKYSDVFVKQHPRCLDDPLLARLQNDLKYLDKDVPIEKMAGDIKVKQAIGFCSTALATLKMLRPDIECNDFGADYYCTEAYYGDDSVLEFFEGVHVGVIESMANEA